MLSKSTYTHLVAYHIALLRGAPLLVLDDLHLLEWDAAARLAVLRALEVEQVVIGLDEPAPAPLPQVAACARAARNPGVSCGRAFPRLRPTGRCGEGGLRAHPAC